MKESIEYSFLSPKSTLRGWWASILILATFYNAILMPMRSTFPFEHRPFVWYPIDYSADLLYALEIVWRMFVGYYHLGVVVTTRKYVIKNYLSTGMALDVISVIPFDFAIWSDPQVHAFLRLNRLLRLVRVQDLFKIREATTKYPTTLRVLRMFAMVVILAHLTACAFFAVVKQEDKMQKGVWPGDAYESWTTGLHLFLDKPIIQSYSRALFWATCFMTGMGPDPNRPRTDIELYFSFAMLLLGVFVFATVVGSVGDLIANRNATRVKFKKKLEIVNLWMRYKGIKTELQDRIRNYYSYIWQRQAGLNDSIILDDMPPHLRSDVYNDLNGDILRRVDLFKPISDDAFLKTLTGKLKPEVYTPRDYIIREGDTGACMFFITRGIVDVILKDVGRVNTLGEGMFFGEIALLVKAARNASIVARTFVDVFVLTKTDVDEALVVFPEYKSAIYREALKKGSEDQNRELRLKLGMAVEGDTFMDETDQAALPLPIIGGAKLNKNFDSNVTPTQWFLYANRLDSKAEALNVMSASELTAVHDTLMDILSSILICQTLSGTGPTSAASTSAAAAARRGPRATADSASSAGPPVRGRPGLATGSAASVADLTARRTSTAPSAASTSAARSRGASRSGVSSRGKARTGTVTTVNLELSEDSPASSLPGSMQAR